MALTNIPSPSCMYFLTLHDNTELVDEACTLLDSSWPKSRFSRFRKLCSQPCPDLPVSIVMVSGEVSDQRHNSDDVIIRFTKAQFNVGECTLFTAARNYSVKVFNTLPP